MKLFGTIWVKKISRGYTTAFSYHCLVLKNKKPGLVFHLWYVNCFTLDFTHYDTGIFDLNAPQILCSSPVNMSRSTSTVMETTAKHTRQVDTKLQTVWESFRQNAALAGGDPPATRLQPHRSIVARRSPNWSLPRREQAEVDHGAADNACDLCCAFRCEYYSRT